ncbi:MAG: hypothetical protein ABMA25_22540, partial [Ilumatobacteraceae bacterium]
MDELAPTTGEPIDPAVLRAAARMTGFARTWDAPDGSRVAVMVVRTESGSDARSFLSGLIGATEGASYQTGLPSTLGRVVDGGLPARLVAWNQGRYSIQVYSMAVTGAVAEVIALQLATAQIELLRATAGAPSSSLSGGISRGVLLSILSIAALVVVVAVLRVLRRVRRKKAPMGLQPWMVQM